MDQQGFDPAHAQQQGIARHPKASKFPSTAPGISDLDVQAFGIPTLGVYRDRTGIERGHHVI